VEKHLKEDEDQTLKIPVQRRRRSKLSPSAGAPKQHEGQIAEDECFKCGEAGEVDECCQTCDEVLSAYWRKGLPEESALNTEQCQKEGRFFFFF
jgi:hypothetical protein